MLPTILTPQQMNTKSKMNTATAICLTLLMVAAPLADPSAEAEMASCGGGLLLLWPCAAFAEGAAPDPTDACCDGLVNLYRDEPRCLCPLLDGALLWLPVDRSLALQLPRLCHLDLTAKAGDGTCSAPSSSPSPLAPPPTTASVGTNASSGAAASPPPRMMNNNVLLGMNKGGRSEVREASNLAVAAAGAVVLLLSETFG